MQTLNNGYMKPRKQAVVSIAIMVPLLGVPATLPAADVTHRCAQLYADAERLSCYDTAFGKPLRAAQPAPAAPMPPPAAAPAVTPPPAALAEIAPQPDKAQRGDDARPARTASTIQAARRLPDGRYELTLQNGELWTQLEPDRRLELKVGEEVTVRSAMLGSFLLVTRGGATTRVRRGK